MNARASVRIALLTVLAASSARAAATNAAPVDHAASLVSYIKSPSMTDLTAVDAAFAYYKAYPAGLDAAAVPVQAAFGEFLASMSDEAIAGLPGPKLAFMRNRLSELERLPEKLTTPAQRQALAVIKHKVAKRKEIVVLGSADAIAHALKASSTASGEPFSLPEVPERLLREGDFAPNRLKPAPGPLAAVQDAISRLATPERKAMFEALLSAFGHQDEIAIRTLEQEEKLYERGRIKEIRVENGELGFVVNVGPYEDRMVFLEHQVSDIHRTTFSDRKSVDAAAAKLTGEPAAAYALLKDALGMNDKVKLSFGEKKLTGIVGHVANFRAAEGGEIFVGFDAGTRGQPAFYSLSRQVKKTERIEDSRPESLDAAAAAFKAEEGRAAMLASLRTALADGALVTVQRRGLLSKPLGVRRLYVRDGAIKFEIEDAKNTYVYDLSEVEQLTRQPAAP